MKHRLLYFISATLVLLTLVSCYSTERTNPFDSTSTNGVLWMVRETNWDAPLGAIFNTYGEEIYSRGFSNGLVMKRWSMNGTLLKETNTGMSPDNEGIAVVGNVIFLLSNQGFVRFDRESLAVLGSWVPAALTIDDFAVDTNATGETNFYTLIGGSFKRFIYPTLSAEWSRSISAADVMIGSDHRPLLFRNPENPKLTSYNVTDGSVITNRTNFQYWNGASLDLQRPRTANGDFYFFVVNTGFTFYRFTSIGVKEFIALNPPLPGIMRSYRALPSGKLLIYADGQYHLYRKP